MATTVPSWNDYHASLYHLGGLRLISLKVSRLHATVELSRWVTAPSPSPWQRDTLSILTKANHESATWNSKNQPRKKIWIHLATNLAHPRRMIPHFIPARSRTAHRTFPRTISTAYHSCTISMKASELHVYHQISNARSCPIFASPHASAATKSTAYSSSSAVSLRLICATWSSLPTFSCARIAAPLRQC